MDARCFKPRDFIAQSKNLTEEVQKSRVLQIKWLQKYEWLLIEWKKLKEETQKLCEEKQVSVVVDSAIRDKRSCLPAPVTGNDEYGWLASKPELLLEKYGPYNPVYPDPFGDLAFLTGKIPLLAPGSGYIL